MDRVALWAEDVYQTVKELQAGNYTATKVKVGARLWEDLCGPVAEGRLTVYGIPVEKAPEMVGYEWLVVSNRVLMWRDHLDFPSDVSDSNAHA